MSRVVRGSEDECAVATFLPEEEKCLRVSFGNGTKQQLPELVLYQHEKVSDRFIIQSNLYISSQSNFLGIQLFSILPRRNTSADADN